MGADAVMFSIGYHDESCREAVAGFGQTTLSDADRDEAPYIVLLGSLDVASGPRNSHRPTVVILTWGVD